MENNDKESQVRCYSVGICVCHVDSLTDLMDFSIVCINI
jgi:hypothetical protein